MPEVRSKHPKFTSSVVNAFIAKAQLHFNDPDLATLFSNCLPYTLDNTIYSHNVDAEKDPLLLETYIVTGDIHAMWLRNSMNQVIPYFPFMHQDIRLFHLIVGLANTQAKLILLDAFANAFEVPDGDPSPHKRDITYSQYKKPAMVKGVFERKFEANSLASFFKLIRLIMTYAPASEHTTIHRLLVKNWLPAITRATNVLVAYAGKMDRVTKPDNPYYYYFKRPHNKVGSLVDGVGPKAAHTGMVRTLFRPSGDPCKLPFNIPVNFMLASECQQLVPLLKRYATIRSVSISNTLTILSQRIMRGIHSYGLIKQKDGNIYYAYEVDGLGQQLFMDDANTPSLLSLPLTTKNAPKLMNKAWYQTTRSKLLNPATDPWYICGGLGVHSGIGSLHTGKGRIWPLSLITQMTTSSDSKEITGLLQGLKNSAMYTGLLHESYSFNNYEDITRAQFGRANAFFAEAILLLLNKYPELLQKTPI